MAGDETENPSIFKHAIMGFMDGNDIYNHPLFYKKIDMSFTCLNFIV